MALRSPVIALAFVVALTLLLTPSTHARLVHVPLVHREVPSSRLFSHTRRQWYSHVADQLGQSLHSNSTPSLRLIHLPSHAATKSERLPAHKMRGNMTPIGEYYLVLLFGGQPIHVQIDTGSATTAVPLRQCRTCRANDNRFDLNLAGSSAGVVRCSSNICQSNTCSGLCPACSSGRNACCSKYLNDACYFKLRYADGSGVSGALVEAPVSIAGLTVPLAFGSMLDASPTFERDDVDGIVGFAYKQLGCNPTCVLPLFDTLVKSGQVDNDIFSLCTGAEGGTLVLGGSNPKLYSGSLTYIPIFQTAVPMFYRIKLSGMSVNGVDANLPSFSVGIVDSGTTLLVITTSAYSALRSYFFKNFCNVPGLCVGRSFNSRSSIDAKHPDSVDISMSNSSARVIRQDGSSAAHAQSWFAPGYCVNLSDDILSKLPSLTIHVKGFDMVLDPSDYMLRHRVQNGLGSVIYRCLGISALSGLEQMPNNVIIGNTVLRKYYVEYDRENSRMGFAPSKNCHDPNAHEPTGTYQIPWTSRLPAWLRRIITVLGLFAIITGIIFCIQEYQRRSTGYQPINSS